MPTESEEAQRQIVSDYRPKAVSVDLEELPFKSGPLVATVKVDGDYNVWYWSREKGARSLNRYGTHRGEEFPHMRAVREALERIPGLNEVIFLGETHSVTNGVPDRLPEVIHKVRSKDPVLHQDIRVKAFDVVSINGKVPPNDYLWCLEEMREWFKGSNGFADTVPFAVVNNSEEARVFWNEWVVQKKYEGVVTRAFDGKQIYKTKPFSTVDAVMIAINKREGLTQERITSIQVALMPNSNGFVQICDVGVHDHKLRATLAKFFFNETNWKSFFVRETKDAFFVKPLVIFEIGYINTLRSSRPVYDPNMSLTGSQEFLTLLSPQILSIRDDKQVVPDDLRLSQLSVDPNQNPNSRAIINPPA